LEIGALHQPASVPPGCTVDYCDAISRDDSIELFPELDSSDLVEVRYIWDLDKEPHLPFAGGKRKSKKNRPRSRGSLVFQPKNLRVRL
jgi:hypothetical protein